MHLKDFCIPRGHGTDGERFLFWFKHAVATGRIAPRERLPSVRALAGHLRRNPETVAGWYRVLAEAGIIISSRTYGTYVNPLPECIETKSCVPLEDLIDRLLLEGRLLGVSERDLLRLVQERAATFRTFRPSPPPR